MRWDITTDGNVWELGLRAGDYDIIPGTPASIKNLKGASGVKVQSDLPGLQLLQIGFNLNIPEGDLPKGDTIPADFFQDKRVRQAFNYAFDYDAMRDWVLSGASTRGSFFIPKGMYGYDEKAPKYDYDPAKAEALFKEAGWWDKGFRLSVVVEGGNLFEEQALILKDGIEDLNEKFQINVMALPEARFDEIMATTRFRLRCGRGRRLSSGIRTPTSWIRPLLTAAGASWPAWARATTTRTRSRP